MPGSSFGTALRVTTAGESHGPGQVVIIDGCPPGLALVPEDFALDLARRRPGQSHLTSARQETDIPELLSGVYDGWTTGTAIAILIHNEDARGKDYAALEHTYRPGHADFSYDQKHGLRDPRGGGRASARETVARVAAGVIAKKIIAEAFGGKVIGYVVAVGEIEAEIVPESVTLDAVERLPDGSPNLVRCPDPIKAAQMQALIEAVRKDGDSIGGEAEIVAHPVPPGLGEPVFDKLKADLGKALLSLPAVVGVGFGAGFALARLRGSAANDPFTTRSGRTVTTSNRHGGILGGISTGMPIVVRAALKPTSSIPKEQDTVTDTGEATTVKVTGRHDPCLVPRFIPMAEAMVALTLADHWLRDRAQNAPLR